MTYRQEHLERIKSLPCLVCLKMGLSPPPISEAHHLEHEARDKDSDYGAVPLCKEHHTGATGYHSIGAERGFIARYKMNHDDMFKMTMRLYALNYATR